MLLVGNGDAIQKIFHFFKMCFHHVGGRLMACAVIYVYIHTLIYYILMKAAILCNGINWTINKNTIYNMSRI